MRRSIRLYGFMIVGFAGVTLSLAAQTVGMQPLGRQQKSRFEIYLDRADLSRSQSDWIETATFGLHGVAAQWESAAAVLADQGIDLPTERDRLNDDLNMMLEQRLTGWLIDRAFTAESGTDTSLLDRAVLQANLRELYRTDSDGNILFDSAGDPITYKTAGLDTDKSDWETAVKNALTQELDNWSTRAAAIRTELLALVPNGSSPFFDDRFSTTEAQYRAAYSLELDTLFQRRESSFLVDRLGDNFSLLKRSDGETADSVVSEIINATARDLQEGIEQLSAGLSAARSSASGNGVTIDPKAWEQSFRRQFDAGMAKWNRAEQQLLIERARWEQTTLNQFQRGERQWGQAYKQLQDARTRWEARIRQVLDRGQERWRQKQSELAGVVAQARADLTEQINDRSAALDTDVSNITQMYNQASTMIATARQSIDYWKKSSADQNEVGNELDFWNATLETYRAYANDAMSRLAAEAANINGGAQVPNSFLSDGSDIGGSYLDDYQAALLGAQATEAYWQKQVDVARAVVDYADNNSSTRPTRAETAADYNSAVAAYRSRLAAYRNAVSALRSSENGLAKNRARLQNDQELLANLDGRLNGARERYRNIVDLYSNDDTSFFRRQLASSYQSLLETIDPAPNGGRESETGAYAGYLSALNAYDIQTEVGMAAKTVKRLVRGESSSNTASLKELSDAADSAKTWSFDVRWTTSENLDDFRDSLARLGLSRTDVTDGESRALYRQFTAEYNNYTGAPVGSDVRALALLRIYGMASRVIGRKQEALTRRLTEIKLLTSRDLASWAAAQGVNLSSKTTDYSDLTADIQEQASAAAAQAFFDRATAEQKILDGIAANPSAVKGIGAVSLLGPGSTPRQIGRSRDAILSALYAGRVGLRGTALADKASADSADLQKIIDLMSSLLASNDPSLIAHGTEIRALASTDALIGSFLKGSGVFTAASAAANASRGIDYGGMLISAPVATKNQSEYLATLLAHDGRLVPEIRSQLGDAAVTSLRELLTSNGLASENPDGTLSFTDAKSLFDTVRQSAGDDPTKIESWVANLRSALSRLSPDLSEGINGQTQAYLAFLDQAFALQLSQEGIDLPQSNTTETTIDSLTSSMKTINGDIATLQANSQGSASDPQALLSALRSLEAVMQTGGFSASHVLPVDITSAQLSARFISEAAVEVAGNLYAAVGSTQATVSRIRDEVAAYLSSNTLANLSRDPLVAPLITKSSGIRSALEKATGELLSRLGYLGSPQDADWIKAGDEIRMEYENSVWNRNAPEWFAGLNPDASRSTLIAFDRDAVEILNSIYTSLSGDWDPGGLSAAAWRDYLTAAYYRGKRTSKRFDDTMQTLARTISANAPTNPFASLDRSLLAGPIPTADIADYYYSASLKSAIDGVIDNTEYDRQTVEETVGDFIAAHPHLTAAQTAGLQSFADSYLALFRGRNGTIAVADRHSAAVDLLRQQLPGATLSSLSTTTSFGGVAAVDLLKQAAGSILDLSDATLDAGQFSLLKSVLIDTSLNPAQSTLLKSISRYSDCTPALDAYLSSLAENTAALSGDDADRSFELDLLFAQGFLAASAAPDPMTAARTFEQGFRSQYLAENLGSLGAARSYGDTLQSLSAAGRDSWFAHAVLSNDGIDRVQAVASSDLYTRTGSDAGERSFALGLDYDLSRLGFTPAERENLDSWMLSISGLHLPAGLQEMLASVDDSPPTRDSLLLLGAPNANAVLWILKRKVTAGEDISRYRNEVEPSTWSQAQDFETHYEYQREYVASAEIGAVRYGASVTASTDFSTAVAVGAEATRDAWIDPLFTPPQGTSVENLLTAFAGIQSAQTRVALDYTVTALSGQLSAMSKRQLSLNAKASLEKNFERILDDGNSSALAFRAYLSDSLINWSDSSVGSNKNRATSVNASQITTSFDDGSFTYVVPDTASSGATGPIGENELLQVINALAVQGSRLNAAMNSATDTALIGSYYSTFSDLSTAPDSSAVKGAYDSLSSDQAYTPDPTAKTAADNARTKLSNLESRTASIEHRIASLGSTLADYLQQQSVNMASASSGVKAQIDSLLMRQTDATHRYNQDIADLEQSSAAYSSLYTSARQALDDLAGARFNLLKAEAVETFASTGYLREQTTDAAATGRPNAYRNAVDPQDRLDAVTAEHMRSRAVLDALRDLDSGASTPTDFMTRTGANQQAYAADYAIYRREYGSSLAMQRISALLTSAAAEQEKKVTADRDALTGNDGLITNTFAAPGGTFTDENGIPGTAAYVRINAPPAGSDLPSFTFGTMADTADTTLDDYFSKTDGSSTYEADRETFLSDLTDYLNTAPNESAGSLISRWSLALQAYLPPTTKRDKDGRNIPVYPDRVDYSTFRMQSSVPEDEGIDQAFKATLAKNASDALDAVEANRDELKLFNYFVAMIILGKDGSNLTSGVNSGRRSAAAQHITPADILQAAYIARGLQVMKGLLDSKRDQHLQRAHADTTAAWSFVGAAATFGIFAWPLAVFYGTLASGLFLAADYENGRADTVNAYIGDYTASAIAGDSTKASTAGAYLREVTVAAGGYGDLHDTLVADQATLSAIKGGIEGGDPIGVGTVQAAVTTALRTAKIDPQEILELANAGISDPAKHYGSVTDFISSYFDPNWNITNAADAVGSMSNLITAYRDDALADLNNDAARLEDARTQNEAAFQGATARLEQTPIGGDPTEPSEVFLVAKRAVQDAAKKAYLDPIFREKDHYNRLFDLAQGFESILDAAVHPELAQAQADILASRHHTLTALYQDRMNRYLAVRQDQWDLMQKELTDRLAQWQSSMQAILDRADVQWSDALRKLETEHTNWTRRFQSAYQDRAVTWDASYAALKVNKNTWIKKAATQAVQAGSRAVLGRLGRSADAGIREVESIIVSSLDLKAPDPGTTVKALLGGYDFTSSITSAQIVSRGIPTVDTAVLSQLGPSIFDTARILTVLQRMRREDTEAIDKRLIIIAAAEARKSVLEAQRRMTDQVGRANENVAAHLDDTLLNAGFSRKGDHYERDTVVDSTINGPVTELHTVDAYRPFEFDPIEPHVDLSESSLLGLSATGIQARMDMAIEDMQDQMETIFGTSDAKETAMVTNWAWKEHDETVTEMKTVTYTVGGEIRRRQEPITIIKTVKNLETTTIDAGIGGGTFGAHVGAAPVMSTTADASAAKTEYGKFLSQSGSGEIGAVLRAFMWSQMESGVGWWKTELPVYDQKLWDDTGRWMKAPTLKEAADVGVAAAGTILTAGTAGAAMFAASAATAALSFGEKAIFTGFDYANRLVSSAQAWTEIGRSAVSGALSVAAGELGRTLAGGLQGLSGLERTIAKTLTNGTRQLIANAGRGFINSWNFDDSTERLTFNRNSFDQTMIGRDALAGYLGGAASTITGDFLAGNLLGFSSNDSIKVENVTNFGGGLANTGVQYAVTGAADLNVLNLADFTGNQDASTGLIELTIGKNGISTQLGTAGMNVSVSELGTILSSTSTFFDQQRIRLYNTTGRVDYAAGYNGIRNVGTALREQYSFADAKARARLSSILADQDKLTVGYLGDGTMGLTTVSGNNRTVNLSTLGMSGDAASQLLAGLVLQHEAYRNGINTGAAGQLAETTAAVLAHAQMALRMTQDPRYAKIVAGMTLTNTAGLADDFDALLAARSGGGLRSLLNYVAADYSSSADYWKLMADGSLAYDGQGYLRDQDGLYINKNGTRSSYPVAGKTIGAAGVETGLLNIVNGGDSGVGYNQFTDGQIQQEQKLLMEAGFTYSGSGDPRSYNWTLTANDGLALAAQSLSLKFGATIADPVFIQDHTSAIFDRSQWSTLGSSYDPAVQARVEDMRSRLAATQRILAEENGKPTTYYQPDPSSPINSLLFNQHDFRDIPAINNWGCNFLDVISLSEMVAGKPLTREQIVSIWKDYAGTDILLRNAIVNDPNAFAHIVLQVLGRSDLGISYPSQSDAAGNVIVGIRHERRYENEPHFTLDTASGAYLYNPGFSLNPVIRRQNIYVYQTTP